ncbi:MAG: hypothetical protein UZ01_02450 [Candidatus Brocadia sinica]|uniref:Uncharacterized protein n=1 Tax=Candidatus Brocadia sinica JPN1 TaxID=1197129 RepID=A0ABQ0K1P4_9BACT|nr:hypothetical protein [Candidatus Brocadia sinica]NOG42772.1 hypothetical protein [Planctomycetota bacterium]KXK29006.1 MAG: hypothetical protein UZ01_02450 [Candidatus Brocadia sinica]GAN34991.1 hypothetical protein BROSI_A3536 [Candidatus Brocadia sinica JPN1]GIK12005.1 MAG: hypothetical protein BroJett002_07120 [Candidatus Brocadia sinica]GJQ18073.1 MAG: hypothetical protein HBSIN01_20320 [Candidatus Brocadia sinica]
MKKDNPKQEAYTILRSAGKSIEEAYKQAGYAGKPGTNPHFSQRVICNIKRFQNT